MAMHGFRQAFGWSRWLIVPLGIVLALFLLLPILIIIPTSLTASPFVEFPPDGLSGRWYSEFFSDPVWTDALRTSVTIALEATLLATVVGTAAALGLRHLTERPQAARYARGLRTLFIMPAIIPLVGYALGLYNVFGFVGDSTSTTPIVLGQAVLAFPLVFVTVAAGLARVSPNLTKAAFSLGASWPKVVWRVELPLVVRNIVAGAVFALALAFDEVVIAFFFNSPTNTTLPVELFVTARESVTPIIAAAAVIVMLVALGTVGLAWSVLTLKSRLEGGDR